MRCVSLMLSSVLSLTLLLCVLPADGFGAISAGAAAIDVTPEKLPALQNGQFLEINQSKVLDRLYARCFVLQSGETTVAIVVVDSCMIPRDICDRAKILARSKTGIPVERILISSTHTHTAPSVMNLCLGTNSDPTYERFLPPRLAEGIAKAYANLEPARVGYTSVGAPEHTHCRRWLRQPDKLGEDPFGDKTVRAMMHPGHQNPDYVCPAGPVDTGLSLLSIQSADGKRPLGLLANYSMHYFGARGGFSSDYYGKFSRLLEEKIGKTGDPEKPFVAAMSQGTSGDLQWMDYSKPRRSDYNIDQYSAELAEIALNAYQNINYDSGTPQLEMAQTTLVLNRRLPFTERLAWAEAINAKRGDRRPKSRPEVYAEQALWIQAHPVEELILQVICIGDLAITAIPNEVYGITGLKLKAQSPFRHTFNMSLANGAAGYIPPPEQHYLGGYTTWPARTAGLEIYAEPQIVGTLLGMLEQISGQERKTLTTDFYTAQQRIAFQLAEAEDNNRVNRGRKIVKSKD
ncbi:neutral/alkaline non-lysosomal ceramidase N-terminal domain-containing protein [Gimesia algae]|uniref:Neutral/alkaline non-lysosomal ceramidase n=1 Tax=Gimesia algae TaxID=2527971 RepID=A0A517VN87_9PLAN|nr:neutral/alkaline non-lysosomal ceramidase N-terminal domain-containing protein [Gimesia algae]QDT94476.1 Neutral/alkaline non-lysosomal ceramidase [Gimesia algae]